MKAVPIVLAVVLLAALGIYAAYMDDPSLPGLGPAGIGMLLMIAGVVLGVRAARDRLPTWAARTTLGLGLLAAVGASVLIHTVTVAAPVFGQPGNLPSMVDTAPPPQYATSVEHARELVRAAVLDQNLPGLSVAVGLRSTASANGNGTIVWAEGFGWRDVDTQTAATANTRFNIGTAAPIVGPAAARLGLTHTGAEPAAEWSPEHIGEPEEDFPGFTIVRDVVFRPFGLAPAQPLPGERATFYVPRSGDDPRSGRRLMYMRDLACCAGTMASYSTAPDVARVGLATGDSVNGTLAGGMVMSLATLRDRRIVVVAVLSNIAHTNTSALAQKIAHAFANR
jgi:hypothetical protein